MLARMVSSLLLILMLPKVVNSEDNDRMNSTGRIKEHRIFIRTEETLNVTLDTRPGSSAHLTITLTPEKRGHAEKTIQEAGIFPVHVILNNKLSFSTHEFKIRLIEDKLEIFVSTLPDYKGTNSDLYSRLKEAELMLKNP